MDYQIHTFPNGLRLLHLPHQGGEVMHAGIVIDAGSRDEEGFPIGIAHFLEHMLFKGTERRKAFHILSRLDAVGGELNAYTTKEKITVYASFLREYLDRALDLLVDVVFHSTYPEKEVKKEIRVVTDEIGMYEDNPEENIYDVFAELLYNNHPLGVNILGDRKSVSSFTAETLREYTSRMFVPSRMVLSVSGQIRFDQLVKKVEALMSNVEGLSPKMKRSKPTVASSFRKDLYKDFTQSYALYGGEGYSLHDPRRFPQALLNNVLGGPGMNSLLSLNIREKYGFCYSIYSDLQLFTDTALFSITFGTDATHCERTCELVEKTLKSLIDKPFTGLAMHRALRQFKGQLAMGQENRISVMLGLSKSLLDTDKISGIEEIYKKLDQLTPVDLQECAKDIMDPNKLSRLCYLPA